MIWDRTRAALELKHWELVKGLLLELRGISMKFLDMHLSLIHISEPTRPY